MVPSYDEYLAYVAKIGVDKVTPYTRSEWDRMSMVQKIGIGAAIRQHS